MRATAQSKISQSLPCPPAPPGTTHTCCRPRYLAAKLIFIFFVVFLVFVVFVLFLEPRINRRETQNCRHFWTRIGSSRLKAVNSHRDRKGPARETQNCRHFWTRVGSSRLKAVNSHRDRKGPARETQNCRHFWTRVGSSRLKSVNSHRDRGVPVRETQSLIIVPSKPSFYTPSSSPSGYPSPTSKNR